MSEFTFLLGEPALSEFRKRKLLHRIRAAAGGDIGLEAHWVYLVEAQTTLAPSDIDALQELVHEGVLVPTAQTVAERAGVGIRTVFRHFDDMETLFATMDLQLRTCFSMVFRSP